MSNEEVTIEENRIEQKPHENHSKQEDTLDWPEPKKPLFRQMSCERQY